MMNWAEALYYGIITGVLIFIWKLGYNWWRSKRKPVWADPELEPSRKLQAIRELAPELLEWVETGVSWTINECPDGRKVERKMREEVNDLVRRFKDLVGV